MIAYGVDSPLILGVIEIGVFLSLVLFGVVAFQGYLYFRNCRADTVALRVLVGSVLFFELCHSVVSCHAIYFFTVILAGVPELQKPANSYSLSLVPVFETLITTAVQGFFAYRIWILSGRIHISLVCWGLGFLRLLGGMAMAVIAFLDVPLEPDYFHLQDTYGWVITSALNVGAVLDVLVAVSLSVYIRKLYTPYNLPKSEELIHRLVTFTIQTGLITSLTSVAVVIAFQTMKHNFVWLALYTFPCKTVFKFSTCVVRLIVRGIFAIINLIRLNARPHNRDTVRAPSPKSWDVTPPRSPKLTIEITRTIEDDHQPLICGIPTSLVTNAGVTL
ncbi:hypothetical protein MSAN_02265500 [Mycena sanguinolenta]|uniref:DUF6534 domain-containing protein n=1 Tax=Mycena sanguinolenta TaxID=230812 RepID=A0A8H7CJ79_9AGAR|nr:hypothetical protein MSAN_02265500 [Mycena sanguinolenta]